MSEVRPYKPDDFNRVAEVLSQAGLFYEPMDSRFRLEEKYTDSPPESIMVAEVDNRVVGTIRFMEDGSMAMIFRLAVEEAYRGQGIGGQLIEETLQVLRDYGYLEAHILVDENDPELQDYWQSRGFEKGSIYRWMTAQLD